MYNRRENRVTERENQNLAEPEATGGTPLAVEETLSREVLYEGRVFRTEHQKVKLADGRVASRDLVFHAGGVCVLAVDESDRIVLVRQYRKAVEDFLWELPAGKLEPGEDPFAAVQRELGEETGLEAGSWSFLGNIFPTPGYCSETIWIYLAEDLKRGAAHPDDGEFLEVSWLPFEEALEKVLANEWKDAKTACAILQLQVRRMMKKGKE